MKVKDLYGNITNWKIKGEIIASSIVDSRHRSNLHVQARNILYELFPTSIILEEVPINTKPGITQYFDFYISKIKLAIEVHGPQHFKFNKLFHSSAKDFLNQKKSDSDKREWCIINNITLVELSFNEKIEEWKKKIEHRQTT